MRNETINSTYKPEPSTGVLEQISKPETAFWAVLLLVLFVSTPHLASTFSELNKFGGIENETIRTVLSWGVGILFSLFLELAMMYFALRNNLLVTVTFMIVSFVLSLRNYQEHLTDINFDSVSGVLISLSIPLLICFVSHSAKLKEKSKEESPAEPTEPLMRSTAEPAAPTPAAPEKPKLPSNAHDPQVYESSSQRPFENRKAERIKAIIKDIRDGELTYDEMAAKHRCGKKTISNIKKEIETPTFA